MEGLAQNEGSKRQKCRIEWKESGNHGIYEYICESVLLFQFDSFIKGLMESVIGNTIFLLKFIISPICRTEPLQN